MRYGVCYKGSKNTISEWICSHFPRRKNFYDLFAGGCAITHRILLESKFQNYYCNDINDEGIRLFLESIHGKHTFETHKKWITRKEFFEKKDDDPYIKYVWSFSNNGRDYLFAKEIEDIKEAWWRAIYESNYELMRKYGVELSGIDFEKDVYKKYLLSKKIISQSKIKYEARMPQLERITALQDLTRLQSLQSLQSSYDEVEICSNSVIYCDIPYRYTNAYGNINKNNFDYEKFYDWAEKQKEPLFISEYWMPEDRFECVDEIKKNVLVCSGADHVAIEKLYVPKWQIKNIPDLVRKEQLEFNF